MEEEELVAHLRFIKRYFLMDQGDFFTHFMNIGEEQLKKPVKDIIPIQLENLLKLAVWMSPVNIDPLKNNLKHVPESTLWIELMPHDLITQVLRVLGTETRQEEAVINGELPKRARSVLEAFSFDYIVKWPLSLIIDRKDLTCYQILFRHLFYCRHVERQLCNVWTTNKAATQLPLHCAEWFAGASVLRQRMVTFVKNIQYYMKYKVIEPAWQVMEKSLKSASNIDDVRSHHTGFLDHCLKGCMLTNPELLKIFSRLMSDCVMFTDCLQRIAQSVQVQTAMERLTLEHGAMMGPPTQGAKTEQAMKKKLTSKFFAEPIAAFQPLAGFESTIDNCNSNFLTHLMDLLAKLSMYSTNDCEHSTINIIYR